MPKKCICFKPLGTFHCLFKAWSNDQKTRKHYWMNVFAVQIVVTASWKNFGTPTPFLKQVVVKRATTVTEYVLDFRETSVNSSCTSFPWDGAVLVSTLTPRPHHANPTTPPHKPYDSTTQTPRPHHANPTLTGFGRRLSTLLLGWGKAGGGGIDCCGGAGGRGFPITPGGGWRALLSRPLQLVTMVTIASDKSCIAVL